MEALFDVSVIGVRKSYGLLSKFLAFSVTACLHLRVTLDSLEMCGKLLFSFNSDGSFPSDEGSSQEVSESLFVGESRNYGFQGGQNKYAGTGGIDQKLRSLPRNR